MNKTFVAYTLLDCEYVKVSESYRNFHNPHWRQTLIGCVVLQVLQDMYKFNISYQIPGVDKTSGDGFYNSSQFYNDSIDIYLRPRALRPQTLEELYPIQPIFKWRLGFIIRDESTAFFQYFYSLPFTNTVWKCIVLMMVFGAVFFSVLGWCEHRLLGTEYCFIYEVFLAFSAVCQHILPLNAILSSRRLAYLSFIMGAYILHCFYTSNLLSRLVNEKEVQMDLEELANSDYEVVIINNMNISGDNKISDFKNLTVIMDKIKDLKVMEQMRAVRSVMSSKTALLTDYVTVYSIFKRLFKMDELCELVETDLISNIPCYLFTSKNFIYKEQFKMGVIRMRETGILKAVAALENYVPLRCKEENIFKGVAVEQLWGAVIILAVAYVLSVIILIGENIYYERNRVWPYVE